MTWDLKEPECLSQARLMVAAPEFVYEQLKFYSENVRSLEGKEELEKLLLKRNEKLINLALAQFATHKKIVQQLYDQACAPTADGDQQAVVSEFMQQGHFAAHIRRMRQLYREQRDALAETLRRRAAGRLDVALPDQGMHLVAYLRDGSSDIAIEAAAQRAGIVVCAISRSYRAARPRSGLMLGFSGFPRQLIVPAAARLATLVASRGRN